MKTLILKSKFILLVSILITFAACSSDDDNAPTAGYNSNTIDVIFFEKGNSSAPSVNWNGNKGSFSLSTPITGLSINPLTGILNWTKEFPVGTHHVEVVVSNNAGQTIINLTLNNPLQGVFTGFYDSTRFFEIEFNSNGTMFLKADDETNPNTAEGNWSINGSTISIDYTYEIGGEFSLSGTLIMGSKATYSGNWFNGHGAISGSKGGSFEIIYDKKYL